MKRYAVPRVVFVNKLDRMVRREGLMKVEGKH